MSVTSVRVAGIDPGSSTGVVVVQLRPGSRSIETAGWVGSCLAHPAAETKSRTKAEGHARLFERLTAYLRGLDVEEVAIECPVDALPSWGASRGVKSNPATLFSLGSSYGMCLAAASAAGVRRIKSYRVRTTRKNEGWMPMVGGHPQRRDATLDELRSLCSRLFPEDVYENGIRTSSAARDLGEDQLMAFGVLRYHLRRTPLPPTE